MKSLMKSFEKDNATKFPQYILCCDEIIFFANNYFIWHVLLRNNTSNKNKIFRGFVNKNIKYSLIGLQFCSVNFVLLCYITLKTEIKFYDIGTLVLKRILNGNYESMGP